MKRRWARRAKERQYVEPCRYRTRQRPAEAQGGARASFSGRNFPRKGERRSRDRGCKDHRILRRVPHDRRHPGQSRAIVFHEAVVTTALAASSPSGPRGNLAELTRACRDRVNQEHARRCVSTGGKRERRQGCQRLGRTGTVGRKRPRSRTPPATERTRGDRNVSELDPPKRSE